MNSKVYFKSLSLENVRCFGSKQTLYFTKNSKPDGEVAMWNVILGENGVGKTTVLKALIASFAQSATIDFYPSLIRNPDLKMKIQTLDSDLYSREFIRTSTDSVSFNVDNRLTTLGTHIIPSYFQIPVIAYGASRKIGNSGITDPMNQIDWLKSNYITLFDETVTLINPEEWLIQADYSSLKNKDDRKVKIVREALKKLLIKEVGSFEIKFEQGSPRVFFKTHYGEVLLHELSLGYKTLLAWITDFAKKLVEKYTESENPLAEPAVCLVDEIDLHMHPRMQREVVKFLRETFPQTQFIVTAHSPLIVQSEEDTNVILLRRKGDEVEVLNEVDDVQNWRIDQILTSDLFGVGAYSQPVEEKIKERRKIILKSKPTDTEKRQLTKIENDLSYLPISESPEVLKALAIIKKATKVNG